MSEANFVHGQKVVLASGGGGGRAQATVLQGEAQRELSTEEKLYKSLADLGEKHEKELADAKAMGEYWKERYEAGIQKHNEFLVRCNQVDKHRQEEMMKRNDRLQQLNLQLIAIRDELNTQIADTQFIINSHLG